MSCDEMTLLSWDYFKFLKCLAKYEKTKMNVQIRWSVLFKIIMQDKQRKDRETGKYTND